MFFVVILGHLLAVLFGFCGVVSLGSLLSGPTFDSAGAFTMALAVASWPLAVAGIIELLVQIACMMEKQMLPGVFGTTGAAPEKSAPFKPVIKKQQAEPASASGQFFRSNPVPESPVVPPLEEPKPSADEAKKNEPVKQEEEKKEPEKPASCLSFFRVD
ncbi:MAG: hypothetical protein IJA81_05195 [Akkermansia sp.]|nr:hypothetical protein [Akkermansia sp.]